MIASFTELDDDSTLTSMVSHAPSVPIMPVSGLANTEGVLTSRTKAVACAFKLMRKFVMALKRISWSLFGTVRLSEVLASQFHHHHSSLELGLESRKSFMNV